MTHKGYQAVNDRSRLTATHHQEPWTADEECSLRLLWDGTEETLVAIAEILGRTVEACRQRYYCPGGDCPEERPTGAHVSGWLVALCEGCSEVTDVFCNGVSQRCEDCVL